MTPDRLLAHYDRIADAPDAIARLRRFVLDLAVRGRLVAQEPNDAPVAHLLKLIASQMPRRKAREAKAESVLEPGQTLAPPFALPAGWAWTDIGNVCSKTGSGSTPRGGRETYVSEGIIFLRSQNVHDDGIRLADVVFIDPATHERMSGTAVHPGDLLLNITGGSIGRCCQVPADFPEANVSQHVAILRVALAGTSSFLHRLILSPYFQAFVQNEQTGAGRGGLPKNRMDRIPVALPPLAEQRRIVAKVDELMALCDKLEAGRVAREAARDRLAAASLARLTIPDPDPAIFTAHARFALNIFPALTTRPDQVKALRRTILNLAVRGELVVQDENNEPATKLLERIKRDAQPSKRSHTIDPQANGGAVPPFSVPAGWKWAMFSQVAIIRSNLVNPKDYASSPHIAPDNIESGTGRLLPYETIGQSGVFSSKHRFSAGCLLYSKIRPALAKIAMVDFDGLCSADMYPLQPLIERKYLFYYMLSEVFIVQSLTEDTRVAMPKINQEALSRILVPVPPIVEQRGIVARVDALMALCARLDAALVTGDDTRRRLQDALLQEVLVAAPANLETAA